MVIERPHIDHLSEAYLAPEHESRLEDSVPEQLALPERL